MIRHRFRASSLLLTLAGLAAAFLGCSKTVLPTLTLTYTYLGYISQRGSAADTLRAPVATLVRGDGYYIIEIWIAEAGGRVSRFDFQGTYLGGFNLPAGIRPVAMSSSGDTLMWIADSSGALVGMDSLGLVKRQVAMPAPNFIASGLDVAPGRIYVSGTLGSGTGALGRVVVLDSLGNLVQSIGATGAEPLQSAGGIAHVDSSVWVTDPAAQKLKQFRPDGRFVSSFGTAGTGAGQWNHPSGVCLTDEGHLLVVDRENHRLQEYLQNGTAVTQLTPALITPPTWATVTSAIAYGASFGYSGEFVYLADAATGKVFVFLRAYADVGKPGDRRPPLLGAGRLAGR